MLMVYMFDSYEELGLYLSKHKELVEQLEPRTVGKRKIQDIRFMVGTELVTKKQLKELSR